MNIFLCGFMGAGKTHFMQSLKERSKQAWDFVDLDERLFEQLKTPGDAHLGESIDRLGWGIFRAEEKKAILEIVTANKNICMSLGGGALNREVVDAIKRNAASLLIWVDTSFEICLKRIQGDPIRPLARQSEAELNHLYTERLCFYQQAHIRMSELESLMSGQNPIDLEQLVIKHVGSA